MLDARLEGDTCVIAYSSMSSALSLDFCSICLPSMDRYIFDVQLRAADDLIRRCIFDQS